MTEIKILSSRFRHLVILSLIFVFSGSVALDQISKHQVHSTMVEWEDPGNPELFRGRFIHVGTLGSETPVPGETPFFIKFKIQYARNWGAAFSMLQSLNAKYRVPFFYAVTFIAVIMIALYLRSTPFAHHFTRLGLIMILSGAVGNFIDRVRYGYVVDFLDFSWNLFGWRHDFAIFNVADVAINIGVIMLILDILLQRREERQSSPKPINQGA